MKEYRYALKQDKREIQMVNKAMMPIDALKNEEKRKGHVT
jgi:hypothetical protein